MLIEIYRPCNVSNSTSWVRLMAKFASDGKTDTVLLNFGRAKRLWCILPHEAKALL